MDTSVLSPAGPAAASIATIAWWLFGGGTLLFVFTMALLVRALRRAPGPVAATRWIVGGGLLLPVAVLTPLLGWSVARTAQLAAPAPAEAMVVTVVGRMWWWELRYRDPASGREVVTANELRLPVGRPVLLALVSADVIHSLWIPALHGKADLVPGRVGRLRVQADRAGTYGAPCAEFCGTQHARMALTVIAEPAADFERWLAREAAPAHDDAAVAIGRAAFVGVGCANCHAVRGHAEHVAEGGPEGPDLTHLASRTRLGAGVLAHDAAARRAWVTGVQAIKPGARMPSFSHLDPATLDAIVAYLGTLE